LQLEEKENYETKKDFNGDKRRRNENYDIIKTSSYYF
jgi:hypothetical protein